MTGSFSRGKGHGRRHKMFGRIKKGKLEFFRGFLYLAEKTGRKEKAMQIRDRPKETARKLIMKNVHLEKNWKKDGWQVRWLCSVLHYAHGQASASIRR